MSTQADKITAAIENLRNNPNLKKLDDSVVALDFEEHFRYQQLQAEMHASGILPTDAALILYQALGEVGSKANGGWSAGTDKATKVIVTKVIGELLKAKVGA